MDVLQPLPTSLLTRSPPFLRELHHEHGRISQGLGTAAGALEPVQQRCGQQTQPRLAEAERSAAAAERGMVKDLSLAG